MHAMSVHHSPHLLACLKLSYSAPAPLLPLHPNPPQSCALCSACRKAKREKCKSSAAQKLRVATIEQKLNVVGGSREDRVVRGRLLGALGVSRSPTYQSKIKFDRQPR